MQFSSATVRFSRLAISAVALAALVACGGDDDEDFAGPVTVSNTLALTDAGRLISFDRAVPATIVGSISVKGLASGETLLGIDVRPADAKVYAVSSLGRIYTIEPSTGITTFKAALVADATDTTLPFTALAGVRFGLDFNPVADRLRLISDTGLNLRINVDSGATTTDGVINGATATITAAAYTNSVVGATATQLFDLDSSTGTVYLQNPPNNGTLTLPLPLGITFTSANGFDIDARTGTAYAALTVSGATALYTVPLTAAAGAPVRVGPIGSGEAITGLTLLPTS